MTTAATCPGPEELLAYVAGPVGDRALPGEARTRVETHAASCASCRETLLALGLGTGEGTAEEEALLSELLAVPPEAGRLDGIPLGGTGTAAGPAFARRPDRGRPGNVAERGRRIPWRVLLPAVASAMVVAVAVLTWLPRDPTPEELVTRLSLASRPTEGRPALDLPYAPFLPRRGGAPAPTLEPALAELRRAKQRDPAGAARPLALLYLFRGEAGDVAKAEAELAEAPPGAATENDRGVVALAVGRLPEALDAFDRAIALDPNLRAAEFNRAVVLTRLGQREAAAEAWRGFLAGAGSSDGGWTDEAMARLRDLER